jgi:hypothetical protein
MPQSTGNELRFQKADPREEQSLESQSAAMAEEGGAGGRVDWPGLERLHSGHDGAGLRQWLAN